MLETTYVVRPKWHGRTYDERNSYPDSLEEALRIREQLKKRYKVIEVLMVVEEIENDEIVSRTVKYF